MHNKKHKQSDRKPRKIRNKTVRCHSKRDGSTQKLYAIAVNRFFGDFKDKDERFRILSKEEERELIEKYKDDRQELENQLVMHNIFLAIGFASKQQYRFRDFDELIALSMYGLRDAAQSFDPSKGWRFNTYAVWYLKKHVLKRFYVKKEYYIANNTTLYLDDTTNTDGDDDGSDYVYGTLNSQIEPSVEELYAKNEMLSQLEHTEHEAHMKNMLSKIVNSVATSSLSETDKKIFNMVFIEKDNIKTISNELGISTNEVTNGKRRILSYINENFSKEEVFAA